MKTSRTLLYAVASVICLSVMVAAQTQSPADKPPAKYAETIKTEDGQKLSLEMVLIPGGSFRMGSAPNEAGREEHEGPQYEVRLLPFYLCTTETTLDLFIAYYQETVTAKRDYDDVQDAKKNAEQAAAEVDAITGPTPVYGDMTMGYDKKNPAIGMTWHNAATFCRWLSKRTGKTYRLPTEAEWEYACRAGGTSALGFGDDPNRLGEYAWYKANSDIETHQVAKKKPNAWGLYDMQGNVREWVQDFYDAAWYQQAAKTNPAVNPTGPQTGKVHVARGGDHGSEPAELRCAARAFEDRSWSMNDPQIPKSKWWLPQMDIIGFRVARSATEK